MGEMTRLTEWVGSLLLRSLDGGTRRLMVESERMAALQSGSMLSRSRVRGRVVAASRPRRCSSFSLSQEDLSVVRPGRRRSMSYSVHRARHNEAAAAATAASQEARDANGDLTFTWSPLPARRAPPGDLCLALFCDDTWADIEQFESLVDVLPAAGAEMPTPTHSSASSTLRRRAARAEEAEEGTRNVLQSSFEDDNEDEAASSFFRLEDEDFGWVDDPTPRAEGGSSRPFTNPRDTPTHHSPLLQSPARKLADVGTEDLTLESLHDLEWLQRMDPGDQMILEVHIIWSILTLMVVLLACYSIQHHAL